MLGFVCFVLLNQAKWPSQIEDIKCAIRYFLFKGAYGEIELGLLVTQQESVLALMSLRR